jgi:hypothetical protein
MCCTVIRIPIVQHIILKSARFSPYCYLYIYIVFFKQSRLLSDWLKLLLMCKYHISITVLLLISGKVVCINRLETPSLVSSFIYSHIHRC